jgi:hypothetical protein
MVWSTLSLGLQLFRHRLLPARSPVRARMTGRRRVRRRKSRLLRRPLVHDYCIGLRSIHHDLNMGHLQACIHIRVHTDNVLTRREHVNLGPCIGQQLYTPLELASGADKSVFLIQFVDYGLIPVEPYSLGGPPSNLRALR